MKEKAGQANAKTWVLRAALFALAIALPIFLQSKEQYHLVHVLVLIEIYTILALGLNVIIGFTGILNLGFAAFYGIGAYSAALLSIHAHLPFWVLLPLCGIITAFAGVLLGAPTLRLRGDYIAIVSLGFVEIVRLCFNNLDAITNGPKGLPGVGQVIAVPQLTLGSFVFQMNNDFKYYFFILAVALLAIFTVSRLHNSRVGRSWVAIREDETAAEAMGVNTTKTKIHAFATGSFFAGIAGCLYAHWIGFITPELFTFWESVLIVSMIVLGGMGSVAGVVLGTVLIVGIPECLRDVLMLLSSGENEALTKSFDNIILARMLIFGAIMVVMVIFRPQGILPALRPAVPERKKKDTEAA